VDFLRIIINHSEVDMENIEETFAKQHDQTMARMLKVIL
jgi:hypothetical protein